MSDIDVPQELIPKNLSEALVAIGRLQVICTNQETKLGEIDAEVTRLRLIDSAQNAVQKFIKYLISVLLGIAAVGATVWAAKGSKPW